MRKSASFAPRFMAYPAGKHRFQQLLDRASLPTRYDLSTRYLRKLQGYQRLPMATGDEVHELPLEDEDDEFLSGDFLDLLSGDFDLPDSNDDQIFVAFDEPIQAQEETSNDASTVTSDTISNATRSSPMTNISAVSSSKVRARRKYSDVLQEEHISKTQNLYERVTEEKAAPETKLVRSGTGVPRPVVRDLRGIYPQMFMNSINSADLMNVQNYFSTFMSGPCTFAINHRIAHSFGLPQVLTAFSPQLFSHYLLGCFVTFPDMVLKMSDSRIITGSNGRTRIEMDTEVFCTKIYDIPDFPWAPEVDALTGLYQNMSVSDAAHSGGGDRSANMESVAVNLANSPVDKSGKTKSKPGKKKKSEAAQSQACLALSASRVAALQRVPVIPKSYMEGLVEGADLWPTPQPLHTKGVITLYLDEHNSMEHVVVDLAEQRNSAWGKFP